MALGRQNLLKEDRKPYFVIMDEFHSFITPSISSILSGARKYSIGLILAHQNLKQIQNSEILESIISNPFIRIAFRLGDNDAKTLESGFSYFEKEDLTNLEIGEAIVRVGKNSNDFNLKTYKLSDEIDESIKLYIIQKSREQYAKPSIEIKNILQDLLPNTEKKEVSPKKIPQKETISGDKELVKNIEYVVEVKNIGDVSELKKQNLIKREEKSVQNREHTYLQTTIKKLGQQYGFLSTIEKETDSGGRIDVALEKDNMKIACEISVTNSIEYEVENIKKCLMDKFDIVLMISKNEQHLNKIKILAESLIPKKDLKQVFFIEPNQVSEFLSISTEPEIKTEVIKGFRVTTEYENQDSGSFKTIRESIARILIKNRKK